MRRLDELGSGVLGPYVPLEPGQLDANVPEGLQEAYCLFKEWLEEFSGDFAKIGIADIATVVGGVDRRGDQALECVRRDRT